MNKYKFYMRAAYNFALSIENKKNYTNLIAVQGMIIFSFKASFPS